MNIKHRKIQHLRLALEKESQMKNSLFKEYILPYRALPEINLKDVDTSVLLFGKKLNQPFIIGAMTGGIAKGKAINENLARAAEASKVALSVGSQRIALEYKKAEESFKIVRACAPTAVIFANMGAVQLNYGKSIDDYKRAVDLVAADALFLHINPLQEALQPEGNTDYSGLLKKIERLVKNIKVPVFAKEVGHGLDQKTCKALFEIGVKGIDVAGNGGTSWAWIEAKRSQKENFVEWFKEFGLSTDYLVQEIANIKKDAFLIAGGGIRNPIQGLKARLLGADFYSAAYPVLKPALESADTLIEMLTDWQKGLQIAMFAIGVKNWREAGKARLFKIGL